MNNESGLNIPPGEGRSVLPESGRSFADLNRGERDAYISRAYSGGSGDDGDGCFWSLGILAAGGVAVYTYFNPYYMLEKFGPAVGIAATGYIGGEIISKKFPSTMGTIAAAAFSIAVYNLAWDSVFDFAASKKIINAIVGPAKGAEAPSSPGAALSKHPIYRIAPQP